MQTFFLATQENGFFVQNDVLRVFPPSGTSAAALPVGPAPVLSLPPGVQPRCAACVGEGACCALRCVVVAVVTVGIALRYAVARSASLLLAACRLARRPACRQELPAAPACPAARTGQPAAAGCPTLHLTSLTPRLARRMRAASLSQPVYHEPMAPYKPSPQLLQVRGAGGMRV